MTPVAAFERLLRVLAAARAADEIRLAAMLAEIEAVRRRIGALKADIGAAGQGTAALSAAEMAATAKWCHRLASAVRAEEVRVAELTASARPLRAALSRAIGRETAAGKLAAQARARARRSASRRAELQTPPEAGQSPP
ncbi:MAG TPA: hypothetical protein VLA52_06630, partial [Thermohalobaculum sp.]|nr:hypothetical protein [Thermohalobaculum sp.]